MNMILAPGFHKSPFGIVIVQSPIHAVEIRKHFMPWSFTYSLVLRKLISLLLAESLGLHKLSNFVYFQTLGHVFGLHCT